MKTPRYYYFFKFCLDGLLIAGLYAGIIYHRFGSFGGVTRVLWGFGIVFLMLFWLLSFLRRDYMQKIPRDALDSFFAFLETFVYSYLLALMSIIFLIPTHPSRQVLGFFLLFGLLTMGGYRYLFNRYFSSYLIKSPHRVLIAGAGEVGKRVADQLGTLFGEQVELLGFLDDNVQGFDYPVLGRLKDFPSFYLENRPDSLFISISNIEEDRMMWLMRQARRVGLPVKIISDVFDIVAQKVRGGSMEKWPVIEIQDTPVRQAQAFVKRSFDLLVGGLLVLLFSPVFLTIALLIKIDSKGPVFFTQRRMKSRDEVFDCLKFRTMIEGADEIKEELMDENEMDGAIFKIKDDPRITRVGKWLRRFSLDELPQLFNVIKGDMSLIGPRPPTPAEVEEYEPWQERRLDGYAGMTGLWQVSGRNKLDFDEMCLLDIYYLENWSLGLDLKILLKTIPVVLTGKGAY